ncbi:MAG: PorT family protein [Prolixibacteraceae bacterium]|nr:PorT family protein [Prolixibacteraceae bacterium]
MRNGGKFVLFVLLLQLTGALSPLSAQLTRDENLSRFDDRPLHFGFYLGANTMDFRMQHFTDVIQNPVFDGNDNLKSRGEVFYNGIHSYRVETYLLKPGFSVGGVVNMRVNSVIDFRCTPGMSLGSRQVKFTDNINQYIIDPKIGAQLYPGITTDRYLSIPSAYIDFPVGFRYKGFRNGNLRPYIYGGAAYRRDLESKRISESVVHLNRNGYYAEVAFGLDTYFPYFRFTGEFKFSYGFNNLVRHDADLTSTTPLPYYGYVLEKLNSNIFSLIFYFE